MQICSSVFGKCGSDSAALAALLLLIAMVGAKESGAQEHAVQRSYLFYKSGSLVDFDLVRHMKLNHVHVWPGVDETDLKGMHLPASLLGGPRYEKIRAAWKQELDTLHSLGVEVLASTSSIGFFPELFEEAGLDPQDYYSRDDQGNPRQLLGIPEFFSSCYNNPHWANHLSAITRLYAEMGFDGCWYDVGGLVDPSVYFCQCTHCQDKWRQYTQQRGLPERPLVRSGLDMTEKVNRDHLRWRLQSWADLLKQLHQVKEEYPRYHLGHNLSVCLRSNFGGIVAFLYREHDLFDLLDLEDGGHGCAPFSMLPSYFLGRCFAPGRPLYMIQQPQNSNGEYTGSCTHKEQHTTYLWEGYAAGASPQNWVRYADVNAEVNTFVAEHPELYRPGRSLANVAIVFSYWTKLFYSKHRSDFIFWTKDGVHPVYFFAQMLIDMHVPFDIILAERDLTAEKMAQYKTIILPDQSCLGTEQISALRNYLHQGGNIVATHHTARFDEDYVERKPGGLDIIAGQVIEKDCQLSIGKGKFVYFAGLPEKDYWEHNDRGLTIRESLAPPKGPPEKVVEAMTWCWQNELPLQVTANALTAVIPWLVDDRLVIHLLNYNLYPDGKTLTPDNNIRIAVRMPAARGVEHFRLHAPEWENPILSKAQQEGQAIVLEIDQLQHYAVIEVELKY